ncbi:LPS O-antigen length regulator [Marinobacter daepoensis]|uniref:Wzz/FepE/Etk N-terminal domain-containing protein n=1 Tax=Marinobacter daepoensis TaxID=262077 RepID=UPI001C987DB7|nr:Wzz/FepE/Etk N-terminal domain-containing protein [Marinobacter daepoensis]MBY6033613.1 LPS O-antigen length regulator [Marinobacter daepoensis]
MNQQMSQTECRDDEIDLKELLLILWRGKWVIILTTVVFAVAAVIYALSKPNIYQSSVLVAPAQEEGGGLRGLASQFGGLASLAGISLGGGSANQTVIAKEVLQSRAFLTSFFNRHNMGVPLMAVEEWNEESEQLVYDKERYNSGAGKWLLDKDGKSFEPTAWEMFEVFKGSHFSLSEAEDTGMITIRVKHYSPFIAKQWAQKLVEDINEHMRQQDVEAAEARIAYLEEKLSETNVAGMQQVFYQLIENETRTVMLANAQNEYVFKTVDPAVVAQEKSEPNRALISIAITMLGGMLGVTFVFLVAFFRYGNQGSSE